MKTEEKEKRKREKKTRSEKYGECSRRIRKGEMVRLFMSVKRGGRGRRSGGGRKRRRGSRRTEKKSCLRGFSPPKAYRALLHYGAKQSRTS